ncbi:MAG TPA: hypothetical protein QF753_12060 [Victivallales bacterium]|nr:hypothetical protein [Victivallales bacterium]
MNTIELAKYIKLEIGDRLSVYKALKVTYSKDKITTENILYTLPLGLINLPKENG